MEIISPTEAILTYEDGTTEKITREYSNVDNPLVSRIDPSKFTYYYFQTTYYDTKTQGDLQSLALGLFSLMPYVGWVGTIASIIETARNMGKPVLYVKVNHYHNSNYSFYKYENYFYTDSKYTQLIKHTTEYKQMW